MEKRAEEGAFRLKLPHIRTIEKDAITQLNELMPHIDVRYDFLPTKDGFICVVYVSKDHFVFDCYGKEKRKHDAKLLAAGTALALLKLLFPIVPLAMFSRVLNLEAVYTPLSTIKLGVHYVCYKLTEIKNGNVYIYADHTAKNYLWTSVPTFKVIEILEPVCPLELLNDPVRFTDWSVGPVTIAQENYISKRLELL